MPVTVRRCDNCTTVNFPFTLFPPFLKKLFLPTHHHFPASAPEKEGQMGCMYHLVCPACPCQVYSFIVHKEENCLTLFLKSPDQQTAIIRNSFQLTEFVFFAYLFIHNKHTLNLCYVRHCARSQKHRKIFGIISLHKILIIIL